MSSKHRYDSELREVMRVIGLSIIESPDAEVLAEAKADGVDLDANAAELRAMFTSTAKAHQKRKFLQAEAEYAREVQTLEHRQFQLPESPAERRALLQLVVAQQAMSGNSFTAKFRDFENLSDSDITGMLKELEALGLIPKE